MANNFNGSVPAVREVISLVSCEDDEKKRRAVRAFPAAPEVISLLSSDDESDDEIVGKVASCPPPPPPHVAALPLTATPFHATGEVAVIAKLDSFWTDPTDRVEIEVESSGSTTAMVLFTVHGKPSPLQRTRFRGKGRATITGYNPSAPLQAPFLKAAKAALSFRFTVPVFPNQPLFARVVFWVRRPKIHFVACDRASGRLKPKFQDQMAHLPHKRLDVDNLAKFVLDALNGYLYRDDSQIVQLQATKAHDHIGSCDGRIEVQVWRLQPKHLRLIVQSPYISFASLDKESSLPVPYSLN
jgi:hypothetical protein